jgi:hypothetical protein
MLLLVHTKIIKMAQRSGNSYVASFGAGAALESKLVQGGRLPSVLSKSTFLSGVANYAISGSVSLRSTISNAAGTLAGRITQTAMSYSAGSAQRVLLTQLSQAVASLAAQVATLQATAPSQKQRSK